MVTGNHQKTSTEENWFGFAAGLRSQCDSDYIALRLLASTEPNATAPTMYKMMIEVVEKSLKFFITVKRKSDTAFTEAKKEFGYNIQGLLQEATKYEAVFDEPDVRKISAQFGDKGGSYLHHLRYGSGKTSSTPHTVNLGEELAVVDKLFFKSILLLPSSECQLFLGGSLLRTLLSDSFVDQYPNRAFTLSALKKDNSHFDTFVERCNQYDEQLKNLLQKKSLPDQ